MNIIKRLFCIHAFEYERDYNGDLIKICRKCGKIDRLR